MSASSSRPRRRGSRRRLSRTIPWQLPTAALLLLCVLTFAVWQPLRTKNQEAQEQVTGQAEATAEAAATAEAPNEVQVEEAELVEVETQEVEVEGDPLDDPTVGPSQLEEADRINILLLGTDGRDEEDGPPRTDLVMLLLVDRRAPRATLISIPRDLWVPIPGYGEGKINTAYFLGSLEDRAAELARETVEELMGVPIDHIAQVDFNGFRTVVDELGGIEIDVPEAIDDPHYPDGNYGTLHLQIPEGRQHMDGETALRYARTRYGGVDQDRAERQQAVLMAVRQKALQPAQLAKAPLLLRTAYRVVETDLSLGDLFALARLGRSLDRSDISMHTLQADGEMVWSSLTWNGQDALLYDPVLLQQTVQDWMMGDDGERAELRTE
ncbi:MAG: LCP family protein [Chloroflexota bacterium]|nr:LCP family protein [Chloroflexota bacterium]